MKAKQHKSNSTTATSLRSRKGPTQAQLAKHLGVSQATVCRVLNSHKSVSPELRERVAKAIEDLEYTPNLYARSLVSQQSSTIGVLLTSTSLTVHLLRLTALTSRLMEEGWLVVNALTDGTSRTEEVGLREFEGRMIDGLVCIHRHHVPDEVLIKRFVNRGRPVIVYSQDPIPRIRTIANDSATGMRTSVAHLVELGHRRIALLTTDSESPEMLQRIHGYQQGMQEHGLTVAPDAILRVPWQGVSSPDDADGYQDAEESTIYANSEYDLGQLGGSLILDQWSREDRPTAVVCATDSLAIGAMHRIREAGLRVPRDLSFTGFNGLSDSRFCDPPLTTMEVDYPGLGRRGADLLLSDLANGGPDPDEVLHERVAGRFIVRASTAPPPRDP
ncbi:LacI family DNA-binding transcriptional regulator [Mucisphaera calidilacus]|uniref:HTH-type transcriptional repressor PurR n=1 Tax=Mucisphaera calidilacus TaxID=2527982 RepID=A0A518BWX3_9BACT|nr:LacI family DNA-binding transcriptional regulator [Mucisphaera calidilacus]QDU71480.1 HTH-type transcriptional repressor PurR [Mucisphaera calidilacus]